jgi:hypothetical protein
MYIVLFLSSIIYADPQKDIAVIYNKKTEINNYTVDFIQEQFNRYKIKYNVTGFQVNDAGGINISDYKAILLLNTSVKKGIDKELAKYIDICNDKSKLILITLLQENKVLNIKCEKASQQINGIDAVTGPSVWKNRGFSNHFSGKNPKEYDIHIEWIKHVLLLIGKK